MTSLSSVQELTGVERPGSRGSVNFSLPTSSRPTSPVSPRLLTSYSPQSTNQQRISAPTNSSLVYDPNTRSFLPLSEILAIEQRVLDASNQQTTKKKRIAPKQNTGKHLADGSIGGRVRGTAIDDMEAFKQAAILAAGGSGRDQSPTRAPIPAPVPPDPLGRQPAISAKAPRTVTISGVASDSESDGQLSYMPNSSDNESEVSSPPSKFNTRVGTLLAKRPSIVREDIEREEEEEDNTPKPAGVQSGLRVDTTTRMMSPSPASRSSADMSYVRGQASASAAYAKERQHLRSVSQPAPVPATSDTAQNEERLGMDGAARGGRVHSVSPARTAHFAQTPDHLAVKHSPPPRSISPRKSALKPSSSDSPRGQSPANGGHYGYGSNASETSTASAGELEDQQPLPRKKAVRVSFDENNVVVGRGAGQEPFVSPITESPLEDFLSKRSWHSLTGRGNKKDTSPTLDNDEIMQPRPALPSFGSVRERKQQIRESVEERPLVKPSEIVDPIDPHLGQSNDHIVGSIISQDATFKNAANISRSREPLPPQVTSVEGNGYYSDGDSTTDRDSMDQFDGENVSGAAPIADTNIIGAGAASDGIPKIAISGATPSLDEAHARKQWPDVPGGWAEGNSSGSGSPGQCESPTSQHRAVNFTPATVGIAEPLPGEAQEGSPVLGHIAAENLHENPTIIEETDESDATSIYSDAAEELSDVEGGFISLDAVVDSPLPDSNSTGIAIAGFPDSPTARTAMGRILMAQLPKRASEPGVDDSWAKTQSYWESLSADKKRELELEAREEADASDSTIEAPKPAPKPKKKKRPVSQPAPLEAQPVMDDRTYMIEPGAQTSPGHYIPAMRSSMRTAPVAAPETHMRMSMRNQGVIRNSMREPQIAQQRGSLVKKNRPMSLPVSAPDVAAVNAHVKALTAVAAARGSRQASQAPALQRRDSGGSESSFKRTRAGESTTFRRSMRSSTIDNPSGRQQSPVQSSRFSLRSLSPTGSGIGRLPFNTAAAPAATNGSMRTSMRNSGPTKSSKLIPSFGRGSSQRAKGNSKPSAKRTSRFSDSSDEEDDTRPAFRSRFVDSSDDETPAPSGAGGTFTRGTMRKNQGVRGIPRPPGIEDGDSSELPDSDDETPSTVGMGFAKKHNGTTTSGSHQGAALGTGLLRRSGSGRNAPAIISPGTYPGPSPTRSRGVNLMSILRRKKADPSSKVRKADIESAARRDTPLERSRSDLQAMRRNDSYNSTGSGKMKLQKRNVITAWPLPADTKTAELDAGDGRPYTADAADGVVGGELNKGTNGELAAPQLGPRRLTVESLPTELDANGAVKARKKKFGRLRRMFRLDE